jgi:hypothetical protein
MGRGLAIAAVLAIMAAGVGTFASAHLERASYWPDPGPDRTVTPATGGAVPKYRGLYTALDSRPPGTTRVVCAGTVPSAAGVRRAERSLRRARRGTATRARRARALSGARRSHARAVSRNRSIRALDASIRSARRNGYKVRPRERTRTLSAREARRLRRFNERLLAKCRYREIQPAVTASRNNDRVVVMPGLYTEPTARRQPTNDPRCTPLKSGFLNDEGQIGALPYKYQVQCPNDQNLIAVIGREPGGGQDPQPPNFDRHRIPNSGACIRCNFQIQGSGVGPDDVTVDAGRVASGDKGPHGAVKDVGIRADRADGFVLANMKFRHAREHGIYILESDGYLLERFKVFFNGEYGVLTFVEDHGLMQHCEAAGSGDSGLYPGSSAETGEERIEGPYRYSQEMRYCDSHHSTSGYSGTDSNAVHVHHNNFYDNALGFTTDVFTGSGHPGFPQDSDLIEHNNFFSNNYNPYLEGSEIDPSIPAPVGTGLWIAGGNNNTVRNNHFWNNHRRGAMLFSVPDAFVCGPIPLLGGGNEQKGCDETKISTSHRNEFHDNVMGRDPQGRRDPNGVDFWWDSFLNNRGNCWYDNKGADGTAASVTKFPALLPTDCATSVGLGGLTQEAELLTCFVAFSADVDTCPWFGNTREPN